VSTQVVRTDKPDPVTNEEAVALWRITLKDPDERKVGRAVANAVTELALATIPGMFGVGSGRAGGAAYGVYRPAVVPAELVPQYVVVLGGERTVVDSVAPEADVVVEAAEGPEGPVAPAPAGPTVAVPIGRLVGARSGDKGGNANLGVFARTDAVWTWLDGWLTTETLRHLLPEAAPFAIDRYRLPALRALNFVIHDLLEEGVAASTRQDAQAKSLGEWLRSRIADVPAVLLEDRAADKGERHE
jgi:hypothetical protein